MEYNKDKKLQIATLCSGYDAQCLGMDRLKSQFPGFDYELAFWSEIDKYAIEAHNAIYPQWKDRNLGDMTKIDWEKCPPIDLLFYSTPCFVAGTLVLTENGYKPIEQIVEGDMVLTHKNEYKKVLKTGKKQSNNIIRLRSMMFDEILCTTNHPFYTREMYRYGHKSVRSFKEPVWKQAHELTKKDYLGFAVNQKSELPSWDGVTLHRGTHYDAVNMLSKYFDNKDFWYLMGRYVGDGWKRDDKTHKCILIACNEKDYDVLSKILERLDFKYTFTQEKTCGKITIYGKEICEFVSRYGKYAYGKHIDAETINLPKELLKSFLDGYVDSDGCFFDNEYRITTVSRELAYGIMQIIAKCFDRYSRIYKHSNIKKHKIGDRNVNQRDTYVIVWHTDKRKQDKAFFENGICWYPLKDIVNTNLSDFVYNMEVEDDNSYTANGAIVHNCQSISQAGLQHGFVEGSGTRSSIIWNTRDAIKALRPKYAILENVAAMVSGKFVGMFNLWQKTLEELGYKNFAKVLNAKDYGVPQNRERIFLVSIRCDSKEEYDACRFYFPEPFELERRLKDVLEDDVDEKYYINDCNINFHK